MEQQHLAENLLDSSLGRQVYFFRPDFQKILENHTLEMIGKHEYSSTLLAFCGSRQVSTELQRIKIEHDTLVAMSGYKRHCIDFKSECLGRAATIKHSDDGARKCCDSDISQTTILCDSVEAPSKGNERSWEF